MNASATSADDRRVLFVHADRAYAKSCEDLLKDAGFKVTLVSNGTEALDRVSHEPYGVVVLPPFLARGEEKQIRATFPTLRNEPFAFQLRYRNIDPASVVDFVKRIANL